MFLFFLARSPAADLTFFFSHSHILYDTNSPPVSLVALFNEWHVVWSLYMFN